MRKKWFWTRENHNWWPNYLEEGDTEESAPECPKGFDELLQKEEKFLDATNLLIQENMEEPPWNQTCQTLIFVFIPQKEQEQNVNQLLALDEE